MEKLAEKYVLLKYARVRDVRGVHGEDFFSGSIEYTQENLPMHSQSFENLPYRKMMTELHKVAVVNPGYDIFSFRTDMKAPAFHFPQDMAMMLRGDPTAFINMMTPKPVKVHVNDVGKADQKVTDAVEQMKNVVRAGADTLADAFGEIVYIKVRADQRRVEDPISGRFVPLDDLRGLLLDGFGPQARWASLFVEDLLGLNADRYYLPRAWNKSGPWISHAELRARFDTYMKEKESCNRPAATPE